MNTIVTQYSVLISAPSDINEEIEIIKKCIDKFNRGEGKRNSINLLTQYWKDDAYPEQGDTPQNILNKQIVETSDAVIAVLWTRFGTPTENYGSGTEEELVKLKEKGKPIFLYFSGKAVNLENLNTTQLKKVKAFKKRIEKQGLYNSFENLQEFEDKLFKHLCDYFTNEKKVAIQNIFKHMECLKIDLKNILSNKFIDSTIQKTLGVDYDEFCHTMIRVFSPKYDNDKNIYSIEGGVPGLFTICEGIFQFNESGYIYIAYINGKKIKYFTNDNKYIAELPKNKTMQEWLNKRKFENLVYFCSVNNERLKIVNGEYVLKRDVGSNAIIKIRAENEIIEFNCHANYGANFAKVDGEAKLIDGYLAIYQDDRGNKLKFTFFDNKIILNESGRFGGNGVNLSGEYYKLT